MLGSGVTRRYPFPEGRSVFLNPFGNSLVASSSLSEGATMQSPPDCNETRSDRAKQQECSYATHLPVDRSRHLFLGSELQRVDHSDNLTENQRQNNQTCHNFEGCILLQDIHHSRKVSASCCRIQNLQLELLVGSNYEHLKSLKTQQIFSSQEIKS